MKTKKYSDKLFCPNYHCRRPIEYAFLKPHYKDTGVIILQDRPLCCYMYTCPKCHHKSTFNSDYVREVWQEEHPDLVTIRKL